MDIKISPKLNVIVTETVKEKVKQVNNAIGEKIYTDLFRNQGSTHLFVKEKFPKLISQWNEDRSLSEIIKDPSFQQHIESKDNLDSFIDNVLNGKLMIYEESENFINEKKGRDYTNVAKSIRVCCFLLDAVILRYINPADRKTISSIESLVRYFRVSLLVGGNIKLSKMPKIVEWNLKTVPIDLLTRFAKHLTLIKKGSGESNNIDNLILLIDQTNSNIPINDTDQKPQPTSSSELSK